MDLNHLNKEQQIAATTTEGPLLILAGAGSGKTATMTHRIAYLVENGVSPFNILAVTFTNKAANEMRERVEKLVGPCPHMWIMTFHAMSLRILRKHAGTVGYEPNFVVYDTVDQKTLIKNIMKEQNVDTKLYPQAMISAVISKQKESDISPDEFFDTIGTYDVKAKTIHKIYKEYDIQLRRNNAMDFDDLLRYCYHVLRDDQAAREEYQERFKYIMVDEYQDTNMIQYEMIKLLAMKHKNLCVVGDDDQCIYQWRGADIRNILNFEKDFKEALVIKLEQNYRSYGNILSAAHSVIKNNRGRKAKKLWTEKAPGNKIVYHRAETDKEEAQYVAQQIDLMEGSPYGYDDFAILYRTNAQSRLFEDALNRRRIPYQILSGFSFYERKETKDAISYMRLVANPSDDLALKRVINAPKRGVGPKTMDKLEAMARMDNVSLFDVLNRPEIVDSLPGKAAPAVKAMVELIELCRNEKDNLTISNIYDNLLSGSGYIKALEAENTVEAEGRIENLLDFKSFIADFEAEKEKLGELATLEEFLERVSTNSDADKYDEEAGKVTLMTIHSAKGLEFPVVFLPGMEDGLFPSSRAMDTETGLEEERRLCYVGMTRAKERLFLASASYRVQYGHGDYARESAFLRELDKSLLDTDGDAVYENNGRANNKLGVDTGTLDGFREEPVRPFAYDPVKFAKREVAMAANRGDTEFEPGDQVSHSKFGFGVVTEVDSKTVSVNFENWGIKKMAKGVAPLKKV